MSPHDLQQAFIVTAERIGVSYLVVEKDFWVTWCLRKLFSLSLPVKMIFKGGTSLSKDYKLIHRLSEDCDITLNRKDFGFIADKDPLLAVSRKKRDKLLDELAEACSQFVSKDLKNALQTYISGFLKGKQWSLEIEDNDPQSLRFYYPQVLPEMTYGGNNYGLNPIKVRNATYDL